MAYTEKNNQKWEVASTLIIAFYPSTTYFLSSSFDKEGVQVHGGKGICSVTHRNYLESGCECRYSSFYTKISFSCPWPVSVLSAKSNKCASDLNGLLLLDFSAAFDIIDAAPDFCDTTFLYSVFYLSLLPSWTSLPLPVS